MLMNLYLTLPQNQLLTIGLTNILTSNGFNPQPTPFVEGEGVFLLQEPQLAGRIYHPGQHLILVTHVVNLKTIYLITRFELNGCIENSDNPEHLLMTVRQNFDGKSYFSPQVLKMLFRNEILELGERMDHLTHREIEVITLTCAGMTNAEIAQKLNIGIRTVNAHKRKILLKTRLKSMEEVIGRAFDYEIL